jgi:hypothetical protein
MSEGHVVVSNIVEEVDFFLLKQETGGNGVHWSITPSLVKESTILVKGIEIVRISLGSQPVKVANLKVGPHVAVIVGVSTVITEIRHGVTLGNVLRMVLHKLLDTVPKRWNGLNVFVQAEHEGVLLAVISHELEGVVVDVAEKLDAWLHTPVPLVVQHQWLLEEEPGLETAHVSVADGITVDDLTFSHILADLAGLVLINVWWERPVFLRDLSIVSRAGNKRCGDLLESLVKWLIIQEDPIVVELSIETILDLTNGASNLPQVGVTGKSDEGSIHAWAWSCCLSKAASSIRRCGLCTGFLDTLRWGWGFWRAAGRSLGSWPSLSLL